ncbi:HAD family hydrolase [Clostridium sp. 19966]|uniref:HAD family hydrolase n=1 Tax=Clostridium sp. 19966 TaxID=2768166 RepID=UPI0028E0137E|nr:HAD family hydrolase [Clostridium sp. 19966]MDT8719067.1 HAD family hydrolase [Clostridium sp. 19966]
MKNIKGILFDKDGTLLDFNSIWVPVAEALAKEIAADLQVDKSCDLEEKLLKSIGVCCGKVEPMGILAWGTVGDIADQLKAVLHEENIKKELLQDIEVIIENKISRLSREKAVLVRPIGDLEKLFEKLKALGVFIGLATSDTYESAKLCLKILKIEEYFDFIGADDGISKSKPNPELLNKFCMACHIKPEEVAVVGDTEVDIELAANGNAALAIAVLSGASGIDTISQQADFILASVHEIIDGNGRFVWCE